MPKKVGEKNPSGGKSRGTAVQQGYPSGGRSTGTAIGSNQAPTSGKTPTKEKREKSFKSVGDGGVPVKRGPRHGNIGAKVGRDI